MTGAGHVMMSDDAVDTVDAVSKDVLGTANFCFAYYDARIFVSLANISKIFSCE